MNPKWIPQLSDASDVARGVVRRPGVHYSCLVPNRRGMDAAVQAGMREVAVFLSASRRTTRRTSTRRSKRRCRRLAKWWGRLARRGAGARLCLDGIWLSLRGRGRRRAGRRSGAQAAGAGRVSDLAGRYDWRGDAGAGRSCAASPACLLPQRGAGAALTTRAARRWPTSWWGQPGHHHR